jgi:hypothetical protein
VFPQLQPSNSWSRHPIFGTGELIIIINPMPIGMHIQHHPTIKKIIVFQGLKSEMLTAQSCQWNTVSCSPLPAGMRPSTPDIKSFAPIVTHWETYIRLY